MQKVLLGECCGDCFAAINYIPSAMPYEHAQAAKVAGEKLSKLCDNENVHSLHTGQYRGFSSCACDGCRSALGGDRYELVGLKEDRRNN